MPEQSFMGGIGDYLNNQVLNFHANPVTQGGVTTQPLTNFWSSMLGNSKEGNPGLLSPAIQGFSAYNSMVNGNKEMDMAQDQWGQLKNLNAANYTNNAVMTNDELKRKRRLAALVDGGSPSAYEQSGRYLQETI